MLKVTAKVIKSCAMMSSTSSITSSISATRPSGKSRSCLKCDKNILTCRNYKKVSKDIARKIIATGFLHAAPAEAPVAGDSAGPYRSHDVDDHALAEDSLTKQAGYICRSCHNKLNATLAMLSLNNFVVDGQGEPKSPMKAAGDGRFKRLSKLKDSPTTLQHRQSKTRCESSSPSPSASASPLASASQSSITPCSTTSRFPDKPIGSIAAGRRRLKYQEREKSTEMTLTCITSSDSGSEEIRKIPVHLQNVVNAAGKGDLRELVSCLQKLPGAAEEMHKCTASSINNECANLCSDPLKSSFGNTTKEKLQQWSYQAQEEELQEKAPTLLTCIKAAAVSPGIEAGNRANPRKTYRSIQPGILGAAGVLLNARNERMNSHQVMNALSVRRGGCGFKTISRLKARGFSVSYPTILRKQVEFGKDYNAKVLEWKETIEKDVQKENDLLKDPDGKSALLKHNAERHRGFMLNGDNVDFRISPRQMTIAQGTTDLHYFQFLAVKNRVADFSLSSDGPKRDVEKEPLSTFLPSVEDNADLREDWLHLIAQVIGKNIPPLCWMSSVLPEHIPHPFMKEMKKKSEVVNLGVLTSNENTHEGMVEILDHMNKYVPVETDGTTPVKIISGGDLLTCERETNTILDRQDSPSPMARWDGLVPVIDDFHTMANFLSVIWTLLYSTSSARDTGTMYAARNFLRAHNVSNDPMKDINASVEFLDKYTEALIVCAALEHFGMEAVTSEPTKHPYDPMTMDPTVYVKEQLHSIVDKFALHEGPDFAKQADYVCPHCQKVYKRLSGIRKHMEDKHSQQAPQASSDTSTQDGEDSVYNYSCASVSICLLFRDFQDARRYGDGARLIRLYKYLLLYFKRTHRTKYSFQSLRLLAQVECMLSPRLAFELTWNRFVNKEGKADTNKEVDRENEHQNKVLKGECKQFNGKISEASVERVSHSAQEIEEILVTCDKVSHVQRKKGLHAGKDTTGDVQKLATAMHKERIFQEKQSRRHHAFPSYPKNPLTQLDLPDLQRWMKATLKKLSCRL